MSQIDGEYIRLLLAAAVGWLFSMANLKIQHRRDDEQKRRRSTGEALAAIAMVGQRSDTLALEVHRMPGCPSIEYSSMPFARPAGPTIDPFFEQSKVRRTQIVDILSQYQTDMMIIAMRHRDTVIGSLATKMIGVLAGLLFDIRTPREFTASAYDPHGHKLRKLVNDAWTLAQPEFHVKRRRFGRGQEPKQDGKARRWTRLSRLSRLSHSGEQ